MSSVEKEYIDNDFNSIVAKLLKRERLFKNYSLEELANKMGNIVSRQMLFKYENGQARIKVDIFNKICKALEIEPSKIWMKVNEIISLNCENEIDKINVKMEMNLDDYFKIEKKMKKQLEDYEILFDKYKDSLTDDDKSKIKDIIEQRQKEIDKELGE